MTKKLKRILMFYSTGLISLSTFLNLSFFREGTEFTAGILTIPVSVYLWSRVLEERKQ